MARAGPRAAAVPGDLALSGPWVLQLKNEVTGLVQGL